MNKEELSRLKKKTKESYFTNQYDVVVECMDSFIEFLMSGYNGYPTNVQKGIDANIDIFRLLRDRAKNGLIVDSRVEWESFRKASENLTYSVFVPWLNEMSQSRGQPFSWTQGGDA